MKFTKLETPDQFEHLKKGDIVIVEWKESALEYRRGKRITTHSIYGLIGKLGERELILDSRKNTYFIINMYLNNTSHAKEAYLVSL
ncbi:hypothetical protein Elgi_38450 [Paenibacillus elgii]|nr:hypothetical protein Elgi_38450 [Paenibacillus elgii]